MSACECCWRDRHNFEEGYDDAGTAYSKALSAHQDRGCVCTKDTIEGKRARAGQFWDEERQVDTREDDADDLRGGNNRTSVDGSDIER